MADGSERRRFPRIVVSAYVDYTGSDVLLYHRINNISLGGLSLTAPAAERPGTIVEIVINFPDLDDSITTQGEVAWVKGDPATGPVEMGLSYLEMAPADRETLQRYLDRVRK